MACPSDTLLLPLVNSSLRPLARAIYSLVTRACACGLEAGAEFPTHGSVLFFKRLLCFRFGSRTREKRVAPRHPVASGFPLKGSVCLAGRDTLSQTSGSSRDPGCIWSGRPANLSASGVSLQLPPAAITVRGERTVLVLALEGHQLELPCVVAHFRTYNSYSLCGLSLQCNNPDILAAYRQLVEALGIGASFVTRKPSGPGRHAPGLTCEQYQGKNKFLLTAWRRTGARELVGFELLLGDFCVKGEARAMEMEIYSRQKENRTAKVARSAPTLSLSAGRHSEVRQLYRWIVLNLPKTVPADLRALLEHFIRKSDIVAQVAAG